MSDPKLTYEDFTSDGKYKVIGTRPIRHDGEDKVTGRAVYGADVRMADLLYGKVLRSPHPHARIISIDTSKVFDLPGVRAVATAEGEGSQGKKVQGFAALLRDLDKLSNRYLPRIPIGRLRLGVGDPTVMDALSFAKVEDKSDRRVIERAYNLTSDLGLVAHDYIAGGAAAMQLAEVRVGFPVRMAQAERLWEA